MAVIPEQWIVGKGKEWLISDRQRILDIPHAHVWSRSTYDAKKFTSIHDARRYADLVGGKVYKFNRGTGKAEPVEDEP